MPRGMSDDKSQIIVQALQRGLSRSQISSVVGVSKRAITRVSTNMRKHGAPKAPASGVKQGRPAALTRAQAEAMLEWVTVRNYTFYVKDLVSYLKDNYNYKGCDGTIRRALVRADFKRKLPWHKSEMTVWIPPDHPPRFDVILEPDDRRKRKTLNAATGTDVTTTNFDQSLEAEHDCEDEEAPHNTSLLHSSSPRATDVSPKDASAQDLSAPSKPEETPSEQRQQHSQPAGNLGDYSIPAEESLPLDPNLSSTQDHAYQFPTDQNPEPLGPQQEPRELNSQSEIPALAQARKPRKPRARKSATSIDATSPSQDPQLQLDVISLQNQIQQQNEMIMRLQQQLAAQSQSQAQSNASQAQMPAQMQFSSQGQSFTGFSDTERLANSQAQRMQNQQALQALQAQYQRQQMEQYGNPF